jgi:hypothetical protein
MSELTKAREVSMVSYLSELGYKPEHTGPARAKYISPLRPETAASFVVNKKTNKWFDYGTRAHGDLIDFVQAYEGVTMTDAIQIINGGSCTRKFNPEEFKEVQQTTINVSSIGAITSEHLIAYLEERRINMDVANKYCVQAKWQFSNNPASWNYGIAFRNDADGMEIRSPQFKVGTSPKTWRTIGEYTPECNVFEGFFDYMSCLSEYGVLGLKNQCYILNSLAFVHMMIEQFRGYDAVNVFFDNDAAGDSKVSLMRDEGVVINDRRALFTGYEDYNEYWINKSK